MAENNKEELEKLWNKKYIYKQDITHLDYSCLSETVQNGMPRQIVWHLLNDINYVINCVCGNPVKWSAELKKYRTFCGQKCASNSEECISNRKQTSLERYGVENAMQNKEIYAKAKRTNIERYGVEYTMQNKEIYAKAKRTNIERYGVEHAMQNADIYAKLVETNLEKYGVTNPGLCIDHNEKIKKTSLEKYGVDHIMHSEIYVEKLKQTLLGRYGVENFKHAHLDKDKVSEFGNNEQFMFLYNSYNNVSDLAEYFGYSTSAIHKRAKELNLPLKHTNKSAAEYKLIDFLRQYVDVEHGVTTILNNKELDIFIPSLRIAIEYDGTYWHSTRYKNDKKYHLNKTEECLQNNIKLLHIFDTEWKEKPDIVKSRILNIIKQTPYKLDARKCKIKLVNFTDVMNFLKDNHIQGAVNSQINVGLYYDDELVSLMTFGKPRMAATDWELLRFCNKLYTNVRGSASKLFSFFITHYDGSIVSYADRRWSNGDIYNTLGFTFSHNSKPNYFYIIDGKLESRWNYQKHKLSEKLENFDKNLTEIENMKINGYYQIYDCGNQVWIYNNIKNED